MPRYAESCLGKDLPLLAVTERELKDLTEEFRKQLNVRIPRNRARKRGVIVEEVDPAAWRGPLEATWRRFVVCVTCG